MCKMGEKGLKIPTCEKKSKHKFRVCPQKLK
jgi:hypothetical protein